MITSLSRLLTHRYFKIVTVLVVLFVFVYYIISNRTSHNDTRKPSAQLYLSNNRDTVKYLLPELSDDEVTENSIFFIDTSHVYELLSFVILGSRQGCCVETAALNHRNKSIFYLVTYPGLVTNTEQFNLKSRSKVLFELMKYDNIKFRSVDLLRFSQNTPLESWFRNGILKSSRYLQEHSSDVMRYLVLWKYGGTYLDTDVVVIKNLDSLPPNYACFQEHGSLNGAVLNADTSPTGKHFMKLCLEEIYKSFNAYYWSSNGPDLLDKVIKTICNITKLGYAETQLDCGGVHVLPKSYFYPYSYPFWRVYLDPSVFSIAMHKMTQAYGFHLWNKLSKTYIVDKNGNDSIYTYHAKKYCPKVYKVSETL